MPDNDNLNEPSDGALNTLYVHACLLSLVIIGFLAKFALLSTLALLVLVAYETYLLFKYQPFSTFFRFVLCLIRLGVFAMLLFFLINNLQPPKLINLGITLWLLSTLIHYVLAIIYGSE